MRTYSSSKRTIRAPELGSSPRSEYSSDIPEQLSPTKNASLKRKRVDSSESLPLSFFSRNTTNTDGKSAQSNDIFFEPPPKKKRVTSSKSVAAPTKRPLAQLHLNLTRTALRTCSLCSLTYTRGAVDDEALHRIHCARISRGAEWTRAEAREEGSTVVELGIPLAGSGGQRGRIISFPANTGGKVGARLATVLDTVNLALSAPPLSAEILAVSKAYLFLAPSKSANRETIIGCVIAQRIEHAMAIVSSPSADTEFVTVQFAEHRSTDPKLSSVTNSTTDTVGPSADEALEGGLFCSPIPLPTPLGIPRMFVASSQRRRGIARHLLDAAARTFIHGCPLDPKKGQVAFSQPTRAGRGVMEKWGAGGVRIYEE